MAKRQKTKSKKGKKQKKKDKERKCHKSTFLYMFGSFSWKNLTLIKPTNHILSVMEFEDLIQQ